MHKLSTNTVLCEIAQLFGQLVIWLSNPTRTLQELSQTTPLFALFSLPYNK